MSANSNTGNSSSTSIETGGKATLSLGNKAKPEAIKVLHPVSAGGDFSGRRAMLTIATAPGEGGKDAVFVGHAGTAFLIPRGKPWDVPIEVAQALQNAVERSYERRIVDGVEQFMPIDSPRHNFLFQEIAQAEAATA